MAFAGFSSEDFETYQAPKRSSAMYTLKRRVVKDKLSALADRLDQLLGIGLGLGGLKRELSDDAPSLVNNRKVDSQWLSWLRGPEQQVQLKALQDEIKLSSPDALDIAVHHKHAQLAVVVDDRWLETSLRIHRRARVDRDNLAVKLKEGWARDALVELLKKCGEGFCLGAVNGRELPEQDVTALRGDDVAAWLEAGAQAEWLVVSATCSVEDAAALGPNIAEASAERLAPLADVYRFVAWAPDNDHVAAKKAIKEAKAEQKRGGFKKGDAVRILAGLWSGKRGTVEDIDKKGALKVLVGLVTVKVDQSDVAPS
ncbi:MAG: hypothetical protein ABIJ09_17230 [Pseudomonadota bacterium]